MNPAPSRSESLLEAVREKLRKDRVTLHKIAKDIGCNYVSLYYVINPNRRQRPRVGPPKFSYELGKKIEDWLQRRQS